MNNDEMRELDKTVCKLALGWTDAEIEAAVALDALHAEYSKLPRKDSFSGEALRDKIEKAERKSPNGRLLRPSRDRAAAMMVMEKCAEKLDTIGEPPDEIVIRRQGGMFTICGYTKGGYFGRSSDTLPLAICKFARQLFTDQKQKI